MGIITYQEEKFSDLKEEITPMLKAHWEELANHKDIRPLDVDWAMYQLMTDNGLLKTYTVRDDNKLIGYSNWIITNTLHYKSWKYAVADVYYLDPEYRKSGTSYDFFFRIQDYLKALEVKSITVQDKLTHPHNNFFNRLGFTPVEQLYEKVL